MQPGKVQLLGGYGLTIFVFLKLAFAAETAQTAALSRPLATLAPVLHPIRVHTLLQTPEAPGSRGEQ